MKRKIVALLMAFALMFNGVTVAYADEALAEIVDENGSVISTCTTTDQLYEQLTAETIKGKTVRLLQNVTLPYNSSSNITSQTGAAFYLYDGETLDLNGFTLTIDANSATLDSGLQTAGIQTFCPNEAGRIVNGTVILDLPADTSSSPGTYAITRFGGGLTLNGVTIKSAEGENLTAGVLAINAQGDDMPLNLENCVIDVGTGKAISTMSDQGLWPDNYKEPVNIVSGSYSNLYDEEEENDGLPTHVTIPTGSRELDVKPTGVTGSVITSPETTAMIVKDGHAYLYDSLQDAVNALPDGEETPTVYLMKESDETVTLPPDTPLKLDTDYAGENGFTGTMQDENGVTLTPSEDGTYESIAVTGVTLSQSSLSLTVGELATLTATVTPANATAQTVTWSSSNPDVASVDQNGLVKALREGSATITASVGGQSAACTVSVKEPPYTGKYSYEVFTSVGDNGTISVDRYATEGDKVTIDVTPDEAYLLDALVVTANGKEVELTDNGDGTYTFTMPSADVRISATFAEDPDWTEPEEPATDVSDIFIDVAPNAWYKDAVQYAYDNGLMTGVSANEFAPDATTTRGMIVSMLARLEGVESANDAGFADVSDEWYATAVNWAASVGVVNGYEDGTFRPNDAITREQLAAILMNYAAYKGEDVSARASLDAYSDAENVSTWATDTMSWAVAEGYITGMTADTLQPQGSATRAQVAAILERYLAE